MMLGRVVRFCLGVGLLVAGRGWATELQAVSMSAEVRVLSGPTGPTVITLQATPDARIDDRTTGAHPAAEGQGPASLGETFTEEISFVVQGPTVSRQAAIDVEDALVSTVRLFPEPGGTRVAVFVRQPVSYTIARPTAAGGIVVTLRPRTTVTAAAERPGGRRPPKARPQGNGDQVAVDAAELQYDQEANVLVARGGVTLTRGTTTLRADEVRYDRTSAVAEARGHVVLVDPEATVEGDAARLDLDDETGWVNGVQADMKQSPYHLTADHIEKLGGPCYRVENGVFTTCRCGGLEPPSWSIASAEADVTVGGVGTAKNATFRVQDTPALYFPYLIFPANNDRQTGFLFPRVGYSNKRGFLYEQPFFWAIDKSSDATIAVDLETAARVGVIGEYRYEWSQQAKGIFTFGYFNQQIGGNPEPITPLSPSQGPTPTNRWVVAGRHSQPFLWGSDAYLDVLRVSDDNFFREIHAFSSTVRGDIQVRSTNFTRSRLGAIKTWEGGSAQMEAASYQDLIDPQDLALNRLPRLTAEHATPLLGNTVVGRLAGEAVNFQRGEGFEGLRLDLAPELTLPFHAGRYVFGSIRGSGHETAYRLTNADQVALVIPDSTSIATIFRAEKDSLPRLDTNHNRLIGQINGRVATEVSRVFRFPYLGLEKIRHTVEPEVQYLYVPQVDRSLFEEPLPRCTQAPGEKPGRNCNGTLFSDGYLFDQLDAIDRRNFLSYGLTTRVFGRGATGTEAAEVALEAEREEEKDEEELGDEFGDIDTDALPQGLSGTTLPTFGPPPAGGTPKKRSVVPASQELLRASLLQGYDISREINGQSHQANLDFQARVTPVSYAGVSYGTSFDVQRGQALARAIGLVLREPTWQPPPGRTSFQSPSSIGVAYRTIAANVNGGSLSGSAEQRLFSNSPIDEIDGAAYLRLGDYMGFLFVGRYDFSTTIESRIDDPNKLRTVGPHFIERDYIGRIMSRCDCWLLEFGVSERTNPTDTTFRVQFTLYGLGSIGQGPNTRGYAALAGLQNLGLRRPWAGGKPDY